MRFFRISIFLLFFIQVLQAQEKQIDTENTSTIPYFYASYGYQWPGGEMKDQFGSNSAIGGGFNVKSSSNLLYGAEYNFLFGNNVENTSEIFEDLLNSDGNIISADGTPAIVATYERGNTVGVKFGKLFPVNKKDKNSGLFFTVGLGYMMHKIRIEVQNENTPQLKGDYKRGYDRLTGGFMLNQAIGFLYFGKNQLLNFTFSVEAVEGWNKPYRDYYFDTMAAVPGERQFDFLIGPKIAWMIPLRARNAGTFYYY